MQVHAAVDSCIYSCIQVQLLEHMYNVAACRRNCWCNCHGSKKCRLARIQGGIWAIRLISQPRLKKKIVLNTNSSIAGGGTDAGSAGELAQLICGYYLQDKYCLAAAKRFQPPLRRCGTSRRDLAVNNRRVEIFLTGQSEWVKNLQPA